jgi:flagellar assembly protein FliH
MRFTLPLPDLSKPAVAPPPPPPDPALLAAIRAEGEAEGLARGLAQGREEGRAEQAAAQAAAVAQSLAAIATALEGAAAAGRDAAEESARELATMLLSAMDVALPASAAREGEEIVLSVLTPLLGAIADKPDAVLRVAPALVEGVAARLPPGAPPVQADASLPEGDARIDWADGGITVALAQRRHAVREALLAAGFEIAGLDLESLEQDA